nr:hypothetical protein [Bacteroidales bacterium]
FVRNEYLKSNEKKIILPKYDTGFYSNLLLSKTLNKINDLIEYFGDKSLMLGDEIEIKGNNFELEVVASVVDETGMQMILRYLENEDLIKIKKDDKETDTKKIMLSVKGWLKYEELENENE